LKGSFFNFLKKRTLEEEFRANKYVSKLQRTQLVEKTGLSDKQIKIWFQNRRMKVIKLEQVNWMTIFKEKNKLDQKIIFFKFQLFKSHFLLSVFDFVAISCEPFLLFGWIIFKRLSTFLISDKHFLIT